MLKSLHRVTKGGGGPDPLPPPVSATEYTVYTCSTVPNIYVDGRLRRSLLVHVLPKILHHLGLRENRAQNTRVTIKDLCFFYLTVSGTINKNSYAWHCVDLRVFILLKFKN